MIRVSNRDVTDSVAMITGGGSGIGRATALALASRGATVIVADSNLNSAAEVVSEIRSRGQRAESTLVDVCSASSCAQLVSSAIAQFQHLDIAVNCAGIVGPSARTADYPLAEWDRVLAVNLTGTFNCIAQQIPAMVASGGGAIVNISSVIGLTGVRGGCAYSAAKHGVIGVTKSAALEYGRVGVRLNVVCPGYVRTRLTVGDESAIPPDILADRVHRTALRRLAEPEELAEVIAWLGSPAASFITGAVITADGGLLAG